MIATTNFKGLKKTIVKDFVHSNQVDTLHVQKTLDDCGISRGGYTEMFCAISKTVKNQILHQIYYANNIKLDMRVI